MTHVTRLLAVRGSVRAARATSNQVPPEPAIARAQPATRVSREEVCLGERPDDPAHGRDDDATRRPQKLRGSPEAPRHGDGHECCLTEGKLGDRPRNVWPRQPSEPHLPPRDDQRRHEGQDDEQPSGARARPLIEHDAAGKAEDRPSSEQSQSLVGQGRVRCGGDNHQTRAHDEAGRSNQNLDSDAPPRDAALGPGLRHTQSMEHGTPHE